MICSVYEHPAMDHYPPICQNQCEKNPYYISLICSKIGHSKGMEVERFYFSYIDCSLKIFILRVYDVNEKL